MDEAGYSKILEELQELKAKVSDLDSRMTVLESSSAHKRETSPSINSPQETITAATKSVGESTSSDNSPATSELRPIERQTPLPLREKRASRSAEKQEQSLETRIGLYWLNRLGVVSLVIGVVFLLLYSFQFFGAPLKLLVGFLIASGLVFFGEKTAKTSERSWYGHGLMGGGWGLAYFTAYAMYFIADLKVIQTYGIELVILLSICCAALARAIHFRAEIVATLSVVLSVVSVALSGAGLISNVAIVVVAVVVALVSLQQNWYALLYIGILASYFGYSAISEPFINPVGSPIDRTYLIKALFLFVYWLVFGVATCFGKEDNPADRRNICIAAVLNAFGAALYTIALTHDRSVDLQSTVIGTSGAIYLASVPLLKGRQMNALEPLHILLGLSALNTAIWLKWSGAPVLCENLAQLLILVWVGLKYNVKAFRWFALFLSVVCFFQWILTTDSDGARFGFTSLRSVSLGVLELSVLAFCTFLYRKQEFVDMQGPFEKSFYKHLFFTGANLVALCLPSYFVDEAWRGTFWTVQAVLNMYLAVSLSQYYYTVVGAITSMWSVAVLIFQGSFIQVLPVCMAAIACYALFTYTLTGRDDQLTRTSRVISAVAGNLIVTKLLGDNLHQAWLSTGWAIQGIILLMIGFHLRQKHLRVFGLIVLALVLLKLLFVDLAQVGTLERIFSFIVAGLVFLGSSYAYSWFTQKMMSDDDKTATS